MLSPKGFAGGLLSVSEMKNSVGTFTAESQGPKQLTRQKRMLWF
jgi:hypothetical protein